MAGFEVKLVFLQLGEAEDVAEDTVFCGFFGDNGDDFNAVAGIQHHEFVGAPELHDHEACAFEARAGQMEGFAFVDV